MKRLAVILMLAACSRSEQPAAPAAPAIPGDTARGKQLVAQYACTACHIIPGTDAKGSLGPNLAGVASRPKISMETVINTPENLRQFIRAPQSLNPESSMPPIGLPEGDAQDIAAFLMTLR